MNNFQHTKRKPFSYMLQEKKLEKDLLKIIIFLYDRWYNKYLMNLYQLFKKAEKENFIKTVRLIAVKSGWCKILQHKEKKNERTILIKDKNQTPDFY
mgnify:CR=1 FL=1